MKEICIGTKESFRDNYSFIRKKECYEQIILDIMNDSKIIFPSRYRRIEKQDNSESDFEDIENCNIKYDAKLLFDNEACIALSKNEFDKFEKNLNKIIGIEIEELNNIKATPLYREMEKRIRSLKQDEIGILFLPFPVVMDSKSFDMSLFINDSFDCCVKEMKINRKLYLIGQCIYGDIILRRLDKVTRNEYLVNKYYGDLISSEIVSFKSIDV